MNPSKPHLRRRDQESDIDTLPVMVPRNDKALVPTSPERVRRLREHLATMLGRMTEHEAVASSRPEPEGFAAVVARTACSLCKGWCCRNGGDDAYVDERTLARVFRVKPEMDASAIIQLYAERVPAVGYEGSCVFQGKQGCTLDRSLRSDICNTYFCAGLSAYLTTEDAATPVVVLAGEGGKMRTSPVLMP